MSHKPFTFLVEDLALTVRGEYLIFRPSPSPRVQETARHRFGAPQLRGGLRADHLTIPLKTREREPHRGHFNVHLTWLDGKHHTVALIHPDELVAFGEQYAVKLVIRMRELVCPLDIDVLAAQGFYALLPTEACLDSLRKFTNAPPSQYRLRVRELEDRLIDQMELAPLEGIEARRADELQKGVPVPIPLVRVFNDKVEHRKMGHFARGFCGGPPGWYSLPDDHAFAAFLDETLTEVLAPGFHDVLHVIARELQIDFDLQPFSTAP